MKVRGADTDRGNVYIRYGPPDFVAVLGPRAIFGETNEITTFWLYDTGLVFTFHGLGGDATARIPAKDLSLAETFKTFQPVRWDNILDVRVDSMPVQVARFRGTHDSVEVLVATLPPYDSISASAIVKEPVLGAFWLLAGLTPVYGDTSRIRAPGVMTWTHAVAAGSYVYRAEASSAGAKRAGKATAVVNAKTDSTTGFALAGFGISDVLLASNAVRTPPSNRWTSANAVPIAGSITRGATLTVIWENYELASARECRNTVLRCRWSGIAPLPADSRCSSQVYRRNSQRSISRTTV